MSGPQDSSQALPLIPPASFKTIAEIQQIPNAELAKKPFTNVIGFVKGYQPPIKSNGTDFKCTIEIMDHSIQYESSGLKINIFKRSLEQMTVTAAVSDIILVRNIVVQMRQGAVSLLSNNASEFHVLQASQIPASISPFPVLKWRSTPQSTCKLPTPAETIYVISANSQVDEVALPSNEVFQEKSLQAMNVKDKFSLLKDVKAGCFYDILGEVIRVFDSRSGPVTVYLSDYTQNAQFFNHAWGETGQPADTRDGDEYGYTKSKTKQVDVWPGPFGKMSIQLTLFDADADFIREKVKVSDWIFLSNVRMKYGKTGGILEGSLWSEDRIKVQVMGLAGESGAVDSRLKEAIGRKRDEKKKFHQQRKEILKEEAGLRDNIKRGNEEPSKNNSKKRRKERRAAGEAKGTRMEAKVAKSPNLNENIRCNQQDHPCTTVADMLKLAILPVTSEEARKMLSPYTNNTYRANLRVVDYMPERIEDFAVGRRASEFDVLSDYSGDEDTDTEEDSSVSGDGDDAEKNWEWTFMLQVEDSNAEAAKDRMWLMVNNQSAQMLLNIEEDANNLRANQNLLTKVKEQLFKLWGDLEEKKTQALQAAKPTRPTPTSLHPESSPLPPRRKAGDQPDLDCDSETENERKGKKPRLSILQDLGLKERSSNIGTAPNNRLAHFKSDQNSNIDLSPNNKPFTCCIRQYGVRVSEEDPSNANVGDGKRPQRMFGLFGTQIL